MTINETVKKNTEKFNEFTIAKSWELDSDKFFVDATPEEIQSHIKQSHLSLIDTMIARLEESKYKNTNQECNCRGWDNSLQKQIDYLKKEKAIITEICYQKI